MVDFSGWIPQDGSRRIDPWADGGANEKVRMGDGGIVSGALRRGGRRVPFDRARAVSGARDHVWDDRLPLFDAVSCRRAVQPYNEGPGGSFRAVVQAARVGAAALFAAGREELEAHTAHLQAGGFRPFEAQPFGGGRGDVPGGARARDLRRAEPCADTLRDTLRRARGFPYHLDTVLCDGARARRGAEVQPPEDNAADRPQGHKYEIIFWRII